MRKKATIIAIMLVMILLPLWFPTGQSLSPRWRRFTWWMTRVIGTVGAVALDRAGNSYVAGQFERVARFGAHTLRSAKIAAFVAKVGRDGQYAWATAVDGGDGLDALRDSFPGPP